MSKIGCYEDVKNNICVRLANPRYEDLKNIPYEEYLDLALVCIYLPDSIESCHYRNITDDVLAEWGIPKDEVFKQAKGNIFALLKPAAVNLFDLWPFNSLRIRFGQKSDQYPITNPSRFLCAAGIACPGVLAALADELDDDLILLPSSIHEFIASSEKVIREGRSDEDINKIIVRVNQETVKKEEWLSDHYYKYVRKTGQIVY